MKHLHDQIMPKSQAFWAYILLPSINLTALFLADPINENITHIAYAKHHFSFVLIWACTCSYYLWCCTAKLIDRLIHHKKSCYILCTISCVFMVISILIPYGQSLEWAKLHVRTAMGATIAYILIFCYVLCQLHFIYPQIKKMLNAYLSIITLLCLLFLLTGCVSTLIEISFVILMGILHYRIRRTLDEQVIS